MVSFMNINGVVSVSYSFNCNKADAVAYFYIANKPSRHTDLAST